MDAEMNMKNQVNEICTKDALRDEAILKAFKPVVSYMNTIDWIEAIAGIINSMSIAEDTMRSDDVYNAILFQKAFIELHNSGVFNE